MGESATTDEQPHGSASETGTRPDAPVGGSEKGSNADRVSSPDAPDAPRHRGKEPEHPIAKAIGNLLHRVRDVEEAIGYAEMASNSQLEKFEAVKNEFNELIEYLKEEMDAKRPVPRGPFVRHVYALMQRIDRQVKTNPQATLCESLLLGLFAAYDDYFGNLLRAIFSTKADLFPALGIQISTADVMSASSIDALKAEILDRFVDDIRRDSYVDQFARLERMFSVDLRKFENWPSFVEKAQRRNLTAHCGGAVSRQYLEACQSAGHQGKAEKGEHLDVGIEYLREACTIVKEVAVKLGHVLWRKVLESPSESADRHLQDLQYDALSIQDWAFSLMVGEFAVAQKKISKDLFKRIFIVNLAISLRYLGGVLESKELLARHDWSSAAGDFRLAVSVLNDDYKTASETMREIGKKGMVIDVTSYHQWPLFNEFRSSAEFLAAYKTIYGQDFVAELEKRVEELNQPSNMGGRMSSDLSAQGESEAMSESRPVTIDGESDRRVASGSPQVESDNAIVTNG